MPKGMSFIIYWESACAPINYMENGYFQLGDITIKINNQKTKIRIMRIFVVRDNKVEK